MPLFKQQYKEEKLTMTTLAIDFGTALLKAAYWDADQQKTVLLELGQGGRQYVPSLFHIDTQGNISFGEEAESRIFLDPMGALENLKLNLHNPIQRIPNRQDMETSRLLAHMYDWLLHSIVKRESYFQGNMPERLAITHPALWDYQWPDYEEVFTRALKNAAHYTGEIEFISEPLAVASAWIHGASVQPGDVALIIDCGDGTIDWSAITVDEQLRPSLVEGCRPESCIGAGWQVESGLFELMLERLDSGQQDYAVKHKPLVMTQLRRLKESEYSDEMSLDNLERLCLPLKEDLFVFEKQDFQKILSEKLLKQVQSGSQSYLSNLLEKRTFTRVSCLFVGGIHSFLEIDEYIRKSLLAVAKEYGMKCAFLKLNEAEFATVHGQAIKIGLKHHPIFDLFDHSEPIKVKSSKNPIYHHIAVENKMNSSNITQIIGFDFGDSETALSQISVNDAHDRPKDISCNLANKNTNIIKTVVGYSKNGDILVGDAAAICENLTHNGLHVGFKVTPEQGDQLYKRLATDFVNTVFNHLSSAGKVDLYSSKVIIGHPSRWKHINHGEPVTILENVIDSTTIGKNTLFEVVPESRGAMIEGIDGNLFKAAHYQYGSVLVVDIGSSTSDFTAVNVSKKESAPIDYGEEIGARLIDRAIATLALHKCSDKELLNELFNKHPEEKARFELFCRTKKEEYYSGTNVVIDTAHVLKVNDKRIYLDFLLDNEIMKSITTEYPIVKINGESLSWRNGFKATLQQVKQNLKIQGVDDIKAILLTGGASQMDFVLDVCVEVFPELNSAIKRSEKPSFDIANGLARWGRKQVQTDKFMQDIDNFCDKKIKKIVEEYVDELYVSVSKTIANEMISIIKQEFDKWKSGNHATISIMNNRIPLEIKNWMDTKLSTEIKKISEPWVKKIAEILFIEISSVENEYNINPGTLSKSFALSSLSGNKVNAKVHINDIDFTDGTSEIIGSISALITGVISAVVALKITAVILAVAYNITSITVGALISALMAGLVGGAGLTPLGWGVIAIVGGAAVIAGKNVKEYLAEKIPVIDLPQVVRKLASTSSIHEKINGKHSEIYRETLNHMREQKELNDEIVNEVTANFAKPLKEIAEDARMLIK